MIIAYSQILMLLAQCVIISLLLLTLFRLRIVFGNGLLYITLGVFQFLQVFLSTSLLVEVSPGVLVSSGSMVLFPGSLFAIVLIYLCEGVFEARKVIYAILVSNFVLGILLIMSWYSFDGVGTNNIYNFPKDFYSQNAKALIIGTFALVFDFFAVIFIYEILAKYIKQLFFRILLTMTLVLSIDSLLISLGLFYNSQDFFVILLSGILFKTLAVIIYSILFSGYLFYLEPNYSNKNRMLPSFYNLFKTLTYFQRYEDTVIDLQQEKQKSSKLESTIYNITDGFVSLDTNWCYTYVNKKAGEFLGRSPSSLMGKHIWTEFPDAVDLPFYKAYYKAVETQQMQYFKEYYHPLERWFENRVYPSQDGLSIYFTDVTDQVKKDIEIRNAKEFSENIINSLQEGLVVISQDFQIVSANPTFCRMTGFSEVELIGDMAPFKFWPPEELKTINDRLKVLNNGGELEGYFESVYVRKDGVRFEVSVLISKIYDANGKMTLFFATIQDITRRKKAAADLKEAKEFSENLITELQEGLAVISLSGELVNVNPAMCKMVGFSKEELIGLKAPFPYWPAESYDDIKTSIDKARSGEQTKFVLKLMRKNGERFQVSLSTGYVKNHEGKVVANFATFRDISAELNALAELKQAKEFSEELIVSLHEGLSVVDLNGKLIKVNQALCEMTGFSENELLGKSLPFPYWPPEFIDEINNAFKNPKQDLGEHKYLTFMRKNGERFPAKLMSSYIKNKEGDTIAYFSTIIDETDRFKTENVLKEISIKAQERKDIIVELAGLVSEEFNDSLNRIVLLSAKALDVERVTIWKYINDNQAIESIKFFDAKNKSFENGYVINIVGFPNYFKAIDKFGTLNIEDAINNPYTNAFAKKYYTPYGISSKLDLSIHGAKGKFGLISFEHIGPTKIFSLQEESFARSIANIVSLMVESKERKNAESELLIINNQLESANIELNHLRGQLERENIYLRNEINLSFNYEEMVYGSVEFSDVLTEVEKVAPTDATVLLLGESGTGKELIARAVHNIGSRKDKPLIKVNCAAIPRELIESELFGHKKGSFTGAVSDKIGKFELADGGTLFLDEIGEMPIDMQPKILRFLQEGEIEVVGGTKIRKLDVRIIAATNRNLKKQIEKKKFREDLYFRINVFPIKIPPLRKRREDIPLLIEHFVNKFGKQYRKDIKFISEEGMRKMQVYDWPGNIRELENLIERAVILTNNEHLNLPEFGSSSEVSSTNEILISNNTVSLDNMQRNHILNVLESCNWKIGGADGASVLLDIKPSTLRDKMKKLNIIKPSKKPR